LDAFTSQLQKALVVPTSEKGSGRGLGPSSQVEVEAAGLIAFGSIVHGWPSLVVRW